MSLGEVGIVVSGVVTLLDALAELIELTELALIELAEVIELAEAIELAELVINGRLGVLTSISVNADQFPAASPAVME